ncbi:hypothetical protein LXA43DRAFT_905789 [Ganoderma leucocontextum]|nr:hypothetical protein LXA43DRAFT_905813 [Ganoderma leucocontextum]KAI1782436.1 hypothetical protein LXA43DRAFT_905789 [Ganoderma leucocontextum]
MLSFAIEYHAVVDQMTMRPGNGLRAYKLSDDAWRVLRQLRRVLKVFKRATLYFSRSHGTYLADVIPAMDHVDNKLTDANLAKEKYDYAIRVACSLAKRTLNKYYSLTDASITYRLAMILHPQHKLEYFKQLKWPKAWQDTARDLVEAEYAANYAGQFDGPQDVGDQMSVGDGTPPPETDNDSAWADEESSDSDDDVRPF